MTLGGGSDNEEDNAEIPVLVVLRDNVKGLSDLLEKAKP